MEFIFERTIAASPDDVFDAWLDPGVPGNPWNMAETLLLNPVVDGFFYWKVKTNPHYGRFLEVARGKRLRHTWMSPSTLGQESTVTVTLERKGDQTAMMLVHSDLPDEEKAKAHERGWNHFLDLFPQQFGRVAASTPFRSQP